MEGKIKLAGHLYYNKIICMDLSLRLSGPISIIQIDIDSTGELL